MPYYEHKDIEKNLQETPTRGVVYVVGGGLGAEVQRH